jgi:hypothetical protein
MWIFVNLYGFNKTTTTQIIKLTFFTNRLASLVLSVIRFAFAIGSSIIYAMRMDAPLLRDENDYLDYGTLFPPFISSSFNPYFQQFKQDSTHTWECL